MKTQKNWVGIVCILSGFPLMFAVGCGDDTPGEACLDGAWDQDGDAATACQPWSECAAGTFAAGVNAASCTAYTACAPGEYVASAGTSAADQLCTSCGSGTFSADADAASCGAWTTCVAGEYISEAGSALNDQACAPCASGTYTSGPNQTLCVDVGSCAPGTVQTAPATMTSPAVCGDCAAGEYCAGAETAAVDCDDGDGTWDHDADPATACVAQTHCIAGERVTGDGSATTDRACEVCAIEEFSNTPDAELCAAWSTCDAGMYVSNTPSGAVDRVCAACMAGTFSAASNATTCATWRVCEAGYVAGAAGSDTTDRTCVPEEWTQQTGTADSDGAWMVAVGDDGSVLVAGYTLGDLGGTHAGGFDAFVRKYDAAGTELWTRQFGTEGNDIAYSVSVGSDGSVVVAGRTDGDLDGTGNAGFQDAFVRKYDAAGTVLWTRQFGTASFDSAFSVAVGSDGSVLVAGFTFGDLGGAGDEGSAFVRKYDALGTEVWTRQFGSRSGDQARSVSVGSDGSVLVAGYTIGDLVGTGNAGAQDAFLRKYDAAGTELWTRQFGTASIDHAYSVSVGGDGSVVVAGSTGGELAGTHAGGFDAWVRKYDAAGSELWSRQIGTASEDQGSSVSVDGAGSVLVAGRTAGALGDTGNAGDFDAFVRKYDAGGDHIWTQQLGTPGLDAALSVSAGRDGSVLVAGYTNGDLGGTNAGGFDAFVINLAAP